MKRFNEYQMLLLGKRFLLFLSLASTADSKKDNVWVGTGTTVDTQINSMNPPDAPRQSNS